MILIFIFIVIIIYIMATYISGGTKEDNIGKIKIFQWNILALPYFIHESYNTYDKNIFNIANRNKIIYNKIAETASQNFIICLQEVDKQTWELLQPIFKKKYQVSWTPYGPEVSGYMGILIAVPAHFKIIDSADIYIDRRWLCMRKTKDFVIASYHAPIIKIPYTTEINQESQNINIQKVMQEFMLFAGTQPAYFAGDFNMVPECLAYNNLPPKLINLYKEKHGTNPKFTVNAEASIPGYIDKFSNTLDYIFGLNLDSKLNSEFKIEIGSLEKNINQLYPTKKHPSDHLFITYEHN